MPLASKPYEEVAAKAQAAIHDSIPVAWKLSPETLALSDDASVTEICRKCGVLTPAQIGITGTELLAELSTSKLSSMEVTEAFCARAVIAHQLTNCLISFFPEEGLQTAKELDERLEKTGKVVGPLHGLPVCIKDMYDLKGQRSIVGFISWHDGVAEKDSSLVKILRDASAVFYCKTMMPSTGMMLETRSELWGVTNGAMVAMEGSPIARSSDIGGSIRAPAAFNGLHSIKPSADRIMKSGLRSAAPSNVSIRVSCDPVAHSVEDLKTFTKVINAHGTLAHYEPNMVPLSWKEVGIPNQKQSFAIWEFDDVIMPPPILHALRETTQKLITAGHEGI